MLLQKVKRTDYRCGEIAIASPGPLHRLRRWEGAQMPFSYQNERLRENVEELVQTLPGASACVCVMSGDDNQIAAMMKQAREARAVWFVVHSLAFAPREELTGEFVEHHPPGLQDGPRRERLFPRCGHAGGDTVDDGRRFSRHADLPRQRARGFRNYNVMGVAKAALEATGAVLAIRSDQEYRVNAVSADRSNTGGARCVRINQIMITIAHSRRFGGRRAGSGRHGAVLVSPLGRGITGGDRRWGLPILGPRLRSE